MNREEERETCHDDQSPHPAFQAAPARATAVLSQQAVPAEEAYPAAGRPGIVVPFTPATGIDILARTLGQKLGEQWKVPVVVDNKAGRERQHRHRGGGQVACRRLHAADDGEHHRPQPHSFSRRSRTTRSRTSRPSRRSRSPAWRWSRTRRSSSKSARSSWRAPRRGPARSTTDRPATARRRDGALQTRPASTSPTCRTAAPARPSPTCSAGSSA